MKKECEYRIGDIIKVYGTLYYVSSGTDEKNDLILQITRLDGNKKHDINRFVFVNIEPDIQICAKVIE